MCANMRSEGGWNAYLAAPPGTDMVDPFINQNMLSTCGRARVGWPCDETIEKLRDAFIEASGKDEQMKVIEQLQARFYEAVPYVNTGLFFQPAVYSAKLRGVPATLTLVGWNIEKP